jgi:hypothetical protein
MIKRRDFIKDATTLAVVPFIIPQVGYESGLQNIDDALMYTHVGTFKIQKCVWKFEKPIQIIRDTKTGDINYYIGRGNGSLHAYIISKQWDRFNTYYSDITKLFRYIQIVQNTPDHIIYTDLSNSLIISSNICDGEILIQFSNAMTRDNKC